MTYQAPTIDFYSPTLPPILQNSTEYLMLALSWKFGVNCCSFGLTHPAACTQVRVLLTCGHVHRPPPNSLKKGTNRLCLSSGFRRYIWNSVEVAQLVFGGGFPTPPPLIGPIHVPIESSCRHNSEHLILKEICTYRPKVTQTPFSWLLVFFLTVNPTSWHC